jgi:hypothetical protein
MAQTSAGPGPIPPAKKDDSEDVAWALSTAEAMYARGDRSDALKWLRRAAEAASEAQADDRALELAKAAADLASAIGPTTSVPPPPPPPPKQAGPSVAPPAIPVPAAAHTRSAPPPPAKAPASAAAAPPPAPPPSKPRGVSPPAKPAAATPKPVARTVSPFGPGGTRPEGRRSGRRSRPEITLSRPPDEVTQSMATDAFPVPHPPEPRRRGRASRPAVEELTPAAPPVVPPPDPTPIPDRETVPADVPRMPATDEIDAWPTQSLAGDDLADPVDEKTRIGVPAYEVSARIASEASSVQKFDEPAIRASQAVRVVVWRAADGVHVAPHGTRVAAISVDAVLVSLDPGTDLASWLSGK